MKHLIKPLDWKVSASTGNDFAFSASHRYAILRDDSNKFVVKKTRLADRHTDHCTGFKTFEAAKAFAEDDHIEKLSAWLNPDPLSDTLNWFKTAKPEPTAKDTTTQLGCAFEEMAELANSVGFEELAEQLTVEANFLKALNENVSKAWLKTLDDVEVLDATTDIKVTLVGFEYMMGYNGNGALTEVNKSNYSKFVDGKAKTDENGKIIKGENYFKPDLEPYVGGDNE